MARLTTKERKRIPKADFALPGKRSRSGGQGEYPIENEVHARNGLARVSQFGTPREKAEVMRKVHEKYPGIKEGRKKSGERGESRREGRGGSGRER